MFYQDIFKAFHEKKVRYLVVGALAMNLYGAPRMTADLDILADLGEDNLRLLWDTVHELGYRPRLPVSFPDFMDPSKRREWVEQKGLMAFTFFHPEIHYQELDLLIDSPVPFESAYPARQTVTAGSIPIPVISMEHLIAMKRAANRAQDVSDVRILERIRSLRTERGGDV